MKNIVNILICTFILSTCTFADAIKDKEISTTVSTLPLTVPALETPAPRTGKAITEIKYSPDQKASLIELKMKSAKEV
jgi:hypothetical protein